jgi:hypothetical protein
MSTHLLELPLRSEPSKLGQIASLLLTANLAGFLMISYMPTALGMDHRSVTIPFRGLMLLLVCYGVYRMLAASHLRLRMSVITTLAMLFWTSYSMRFVADAVLLQVPLGEEPWEIAMYLFGICLPTFAVFYLISDVRLYRGALVWTMLALGVCCAISMHFTAISQDAVQHGRYAGNDILNPIGYGHMGLTAMILGLFVLLRIGRVNRPWLLNVPAAGTVCLGGFTILAAGSRGALVATILLIPFVVYLGLRRGSKMLTIGICVALVFVLSATATYLSQRGMNLDRLMGSAAAYTSANNSVLARQNMIREAWHEYLNHPWLGSSIVERDALSYPHNAIIEAFMAIGTFGGAVFTILTLLAMFRAIRLIKRDVVMAWVPICFFQYLIGAMFSGGLFCNPLLWGMMAIMLGVDMPPTRARQPQIQKA